MSIAVAARRASSSASWTSAASNRRLAPELASVSVPNVRPCARSAAMMIERRSSLRTSARCSGSGMPATSIASVISGTNAVSPLRATRIVPPSAPRSGGQRRLSSSPSRRWPGSTWAAATCCSAPVSSMMLTAHQSAISGTAMPATERSVRS